MASGNNVEIDMLGRECRRLEINTNIGRPEEFLSAILNTRMHRT